MKLLKLTLLTTLILSQASFAVTQPVKKVYAHPTCEIAENPLMMALSNYKTGPEFQEKVAKAFAAKSYTVVPNGEIFVHRFTIEAKAGDPVKNKKVKQYRLSNGAELLPEVEESYTYPIKCTYDIRYKDGGLHNKSGLVISRNQGRPITIVNRKIMTNYISGFQYYTHDLELEGFSSIKDIALEHCLDINSEETIIKFIKMLPKCEKL